MTTTELIKILQDNEKGGISHKPRNISLSINGRYMSNPQILLSSTGDGICGSEIDLDIEGEWFEQQPNRCDSCTHSEEQDGSNCYECVKGMADNFEEQPTSDDEIIKALKAVRTFHNGNYAPQIDEAIRRLTMKKSAYVQVNLSDERIQKAVAEVVEKMKAEIEAQPSEKCISRQAVLDVIDFEDEWLFDAKSHNADTHIAFSGLERR